MTDPLDLGLELECKYCDYKETIIVGELIQDAFPYLTAGQRELMLSNTCDTCWNKFFPEDDDDEHNE
jgi:DNA-directed RNA polymerase subunit RPC12/RpoP